MKNPEEPKNDPDFTKRLQKRISYLTRSLRQKLEQDALLEKERVAFATMSVKDRIIEINKNFSRHLTNNQFWVDNKGLLGGNTQGIFRPGQIVVGIKLVNKVCHFYVAVIGDSLSKRQINYALSHISGYRLISSSYDIAKVEERYFLITLRIVPLTRIESILSIATPLNVRGKYSISPHIPIEARLIEDHGLLTIADPPEDKYLRTISIINPIDSQIKLRKEMAHQLADIPKGRTNKYTYLITNYGVPSRYFTGRQIQLSNKPPARDLFKRVVKKPSSQTVIHN